MPERGLEQPTPVGRILRRVGAVLIVVGTVDVAWMIHAISSGWSYSTSYGFFAWIGGACLWRGSPRAARIVAQAGALLFAATAGALLVSPLLVPADLVRTWLAIVPPIRLAAGAALSGFLIALPWWTYRSLTKPVVRATYAAQESTLRRRPEAGFVAGATIVAIGVVVALAFERGSRHEEAVRRASELRPGLAYFVSGLSSASVGRGRTQVRATVLAYSESEIEKLDIEWRE